MPKHGLRMDFYLRSVTGVTEIVLFVPAVGFLSFYMVFRQCDVPEYFLLINLLVNIRSTKFIWFMMCYPDESKVLLFEMGSVRHRLGRRNTFKAP